MTMTPVDFQEALALIVVAAVVATALWRRSRRRAKSGPGCSNCDKPVAKVKEIPLRFHRRKP